MFCSPCHPCSVSLLEKQVSFFLFLFPVVRLAFLDSPFQISSSITVQSPVLRPEGTMVGPEELKDLVGHPRFWVRVIPYAVVTLLIQNLQCECFQVLVLK